MRGELFHHTGRMVSLLINGIILSGLLLLILSFKYPDLPKVIFYKAFREYTSSSMNWKTRHWERLEGEKFILRYQPGDANVAKMVLDTAEESCNSVNQTLNFYPKGKVPIILYPDVATLNRSFGWAADESAMGVYWAGVIRVLSPNCWIEAGDQEEIFRAEGPMSHEYAHFIVDYIAGGNYPRWLTEGIAQQVERNISGFEMPLTGATKIYRLSQMDREFDLLPNQSAAYRQSLAMVDFLVSEYGADALDEILRKLGKGVTLDKAFVEVLMIDVKGFENNFLESLK